MSTEMIETIREYFKTQPVLKAWIFGSYARGEETEDSDVDILVKYDDTDRTVGLMKIASMYVALKKMLNREVDLVEEGTLLPFAVKSADNDKILIYEREPVRDKERLVHIIEAIDRIHNRTPALDLDNLLQDALVYYGVVKSIEIIGEAVYKLSTSFKDAHPQTVWENIEGMRHVLVHDYYQILPDRVLDVVINDLPPLKAQIEQYLSEIE